MSLIGKTKMNLLRSLRQSPKHGYQLHKELDITTSTVYRHLNELEDAGVAAATDSSDQDRIEYALTDKGEQLLALLLDD